MADYVATIDDSGGIEPLVKWGGIYVPGDHPIVCITALLIKIDLVDEFNQRWLDLRHEIQNHLGCNYLPPIHMRLMYGRHKPPRYRSKPNPYLDCEFDKVIEWVAKGVQIIEDIRSRPKCLHWASIWDLRKDLADRILRYYSDPTLVNELRFMRAHGKRSAKRSFAQKYLNKMSSPLLPLLTKQILQLNEFMRQLRGSSIELWLDPFADSSGMDAAEILEAVRKVTDVPCISRISIMSDTDNVQLAQAVDLIGFLNFRRIMAANSFIAVDPILEKIYDQNIIPKSFINADVTHIINRRLEKNPGLITSIHYAVARAAVEGMDPGFANEHLLTVDELREAVSGFKRFTTGHSILKPQTLEGLRNGEDPS